MKAEEFNGRPYAAGSLFGVRSFAVTASGRLTGPLTGAPFGPGENVATCRLGPIQRMIAQSLRAAPGFVHVNVQHALGHRQPHRAGQLDCTCGFYAYTDTKANPHHDTTRVLAIIEGYGVCTVGSRGFRAEKARLVALVSPRGIAANFSWAYCATSAALGLPMACIDAWQGHLWWAAFMLVLSISSGLLAWHHIRALAARPDFTPIRRHYPNVPVYRSLKAATAAHPLSAPEPAPVPPRWSNSPWTTP